ncbi:hypothetical protein FDP41_000871 [Naegleria fowleri]|uniref:Uncharacterized protein n=1 Tax=Naegleria fowleri TaxID=5763 RepID=A0A6A5BPX2_NAEFO|nr:uncharacterized protein FDP41_000871 [Naegleria fowleri]KAF0980093.1 hypothetical protein FDP41_000871 [Naegleria fowleri]
MSSQRTFNFRSEHSSQSPSSKDPSCSKQKDSTKPNAFYSLKMNKNTVYQNRTSRGTLYLSRSTCFTLSFVILFGFINIFLCLIFSSTRTLLSHQNIIPFTGWNHLTKSLSLPCSTLFHAIWSVFTFTLFLLDKCLAKLSGKPSSLTKLFPIKTNGSNGNGKSSYSRRVPEMLLLTSVLLGGFWGGLIGMIGCCHKTRKWKFWLVEVIAFVLHVVLQSQILVSETNQTIM